MIKEVCSVVGCANYHPEFNRNCKRVASKCPNYSPVNQILEESNTIAPTKKRGHILQKAHEIINGERQDSYGSPEDSFGLIAEYWSSYLKSRQKVKGGSGLSIYPNEVAEMMMLFKIARMSGQKPSIDNYCDLAGYAGIAADMVG